MHDRRFHRLLEGKSKFAADDDELEEHLEVSCHTATRCQRGRDAPVAGATVSTVTSEHQRDVNTVDASRS